jgi:hypothetical protein
LRNHKRCFTRFFESTRKWPPIAPPPCQMNQLIEKSFFHCYCCFLVFPTSLPWQSYYVTIFKDLLLLLRYMSSKFVHFFSVCIAHYASACTAHLCWESKRDVDTHQMAPKQRLEQRIILEDERGKVLNKTPS